ncbi:MAG: endolytic transglycosylase MltG [Anaerolineaceae bacterium]
MNRKKKSNLPAFLAFVLLFLCVAMVFVLAKILADAAYIYGQPVDTLLFFDRLSLSVNLLSHQKQLLIPVNPAGSQIGFTIDPAERVDDIARQMQNLGLITDAQAWVDYLVYHGYDVSLKAGSYLMSPASSPVQIAELMQDPNSQEVVFSILPGWRLEEIGASLPTSGLAISPEEFLAFTTGGDFSGLDARLPGNLTSLEGFLLPGQYAVTRGTSLDELLPIILSQFFQVVSGDLTQGFNNQRLSLEQAVILASIVQREALVQDEMPLIASVFFNRLAADMRLGSDPTVQYAIGFDAAKNSWWKVPLDTNDLGVHSPYNTYLVAGLPHAPICSPGAEALQAVANPANTGYFFFRALCDGSGRHAFAKTYEEHLNNACG